MRRFSPTLRESLSVSPQNKKLDRMILSCRRDRNSTGILWAFIVSARRILYPLPYLFWPAKLFETMHGSFLLNNGIKFVSDGSKIDITISMGNGKRY